MSGHCYTSPALLPPFFFEENFFLFHTVQFKCTGSLDYGVSNKVPVASRQKIKREGDSGEFFSFNTGHG